MRSPVPHSTAGSPCNDAGRKLAPKSRTSRTNSNQLDSLSELNGPIRTGVTLGVSGQPVPTEVRSALNYVGSRGPRFDFSSERLPFLDPLIRKYARDKLFDLAAKIPEPSARSSPLEPTEDARAAVRKLYDFLVEGFDFPRLVKLMNERFERPTHHMPYGSFQADAALACLYDSVRTKRFVSAIASHLEDLLVERDGVVNVVEAGCGPVPILSLAAAFYSPRVRVVAIEANKASAEIAKLIVEKFRLSEQITVINGDANEFEPEQKIDLLISETLDSALNSENFIKIIDNLQRFLASGARTIPEQIRISQSVPIDPIHAEVERHLAPADFNYRSCFDWSRFSDRNLIHIGSDVEVTVSKDVETNYPSPIHLSTEFILYHARHGKEPIALAPGESFVSRYLCFRSSVEILNDFWREMDSNFLRGSERFRLDYSYSPGQMVGAEYDFAISIVEQGF